eukprot:TRINITY_DN6507_c0_g1_i1.p1 TRINITY_DN6507_c0_g1~~TRINITY_DN6507_c0_g1_i1.p1  ORF type:complete len:838 (+),score=91.16 TRINITY_DN6507_c0_g1_i1:201-2714(+)
MAEAIAVDGKATLPVQKDEPQLLRRRWLMLGILSVDICVSYLPYYTFVPILRQGMQVYGADESALNMLCIFFALVYVPGAFLSGPLVGMLGCRWTFVLAMAINAFGCAVRSGDMFFFPFSDRFLQSSGGSSFISDHNSSVDDSVVVAPQTLPFSLLLAGQLLCASGQPLLVDAASEMGAEWFPPHERPTAAMVNNLMNFVGSSLSFMMPPLFVEDRTDNLEVTEFQVQMLLRAQFCIALAAFLATLLFYRQPPQSSASHLATRPATTFSAELLWLLGLHDFWLVTAQFSVYVTIGHAFDAVEGSLLEHYGYHASLTSWTAVSCSIASVISTVLASRWISDASQYHAALLVSNGVLALSLLMAFACLLFQMHRYFFVLAVGVLGLSTPGWGCSCEFASEVCFPARETTVNSLLEAFSNLLGVAGIMATQKLIDKGVGVNVLFFMAVAAAFGGSLMTCTHGRLLRSQAEASSHDDVSPISFSNRKVPSGRVCVESLGSRFARRWSKCRKRKRLNASSAYFFFTVVASFLIVVFYVMTDVGFRWGLSGSQISSGMLATAPRHPIIAPPIIIPSSTSSTPTIMMHCSEDRFAFERSRRCLRYTNLTFDVFRCNSHESITDEVEEAVRERLLPISALSALGGVSRLGKDRGIMLAFAARHLRLLKNLTAKAFKVANIISSTEVVKESFRERRTALLKKLPKNWDFVNLNAHRPAGDKLRFPQKRSTKKGSRNDSATAWMKNKVFRMRRGLSPWTNERLGNYLVTKKGAKKILAFGLSYDTFGKWESFGTFLLSHFYSAPDFLGFAVEANRLSLSNPKDKRLGGRANTSHIGKTSNVLPTCMQ